MFRGPRRINVLLLPILIVVLFVLRPSLLHRQASAPPPPAASAPGASAAPESRAPQTDAQGFGPGVAFRSSERLAEHFDKHGAEVGAATEAEYLRRAQALRDRAVGGDVLELRRDDGVTCRYDRATGEFIAFNRDGTLRTFFKPRNGERYFERQSQRTGP